MRIIHVVRQFYPGVGGLENFVFSLAKQQVAEGHFVTVVTLDRLLNEPERVLPKYQYVSGIDICRIPFRGSNRYPIAPAVLEAVSDGDVVHVHGIDFFCDFLSLTRFIHRKPLVISTHGGFFHTTFAQDLKRVFFSTVTRLSLKGYRAVYACSENDYQTFSKVCDKRLQLIRNGVDTEKFHDAAAPSATKSVIYLGRLSPNKRLDRLIETFAVVSRSDPGVRLHIVGNDWNGVRAKLEGQLSSLGLTEQVTIHSGLDDEQTRALMRQCSYFASASEYEGFGLTLVEAMSAGLVPLVNRIPTFKSQLENLDVGLLTDFSDSAVAGRDILNQMAVVEKNYPEMRARAMAATMPYSWKETAGRFMEDYKRHVSPADRREILGVTFAVRTRGSAVGSIDDAIETGKQVKVAFANAHTLNIAAGRADMRSALRSFLVLNDGVGVNIASRLWFSQPFSENLNGTDFVPHYLHASRHKLRIYLLGAKPAVIAEAARKFKERWPRHEIVGYQNGYFANTGDISAVCDTIREKGADLVLVGLGNPQQELWINSYADKTGACALMGVGALFDFVAGAVPRAPYWVRRLRCEWLFRLVQEPRRLWRRYLLGNAMFMVRVMTPRGLGGATSTRQ